MVGHLRVSEFVDRHGNRSRGCRCHLQNNGPDATLAPPHAEGVVISTSVAELPGDVAERQRDATELQRVHQRARISADAAPAASTYLSKRLDAARATHDGVIPRPHDMREIDSAVKRLDEGRGADETAAMIRPRQGLWQDRSGRCTQQQHASSRAWRRVLYDVQGSAFSWASNLGRCYGAPDPASRGSRRAGATTQAGHAPSRLAARRSTERPRAPATPPNYSRSSRKSEHRSR